MVTDEYGTVGYTQQEILDYLRINPNFDITGIFLTDGNSYKKGLDNPYLDKMPKVNMWDERTYAMPSKEYHKILQSIWLMPDEYSELDIKTLILNKAKTIEEKNRVEEELKLYEKYDLINLLRYLKYLKDTADKHKIVWGVGRGSSCASYCLFLLGVHRVDSLFYKLDIKEFLKD